MPSKRKTFRAPDNRETPLSIRAALRAARGAANHDQERAARDLGVSVSTLCAWEKGQRAIRPGYVAGIVVYARRHLPGVCIEGA